RYLFFGYCLFSSHGWTAGMQPETPVLEVYEEDGEASINVTNTGSDAALLYVRTSLIDEEKNSGIKLIPTQPVVRVESGKRQQVRFILQTTKPLMVEHMMRAQFSGIPSKNADEKKTDNIKLNVIYTQDIPVIITPKNIKKNKEPWGDLKFKQQGTNLQVVNTGAYVIRLSPEIIIPENNKMVDLLRTFILPGETLTATLSSSLPINQVILQPLSRYGIKVNSVNLPVDH
ncbi:TPA: fimbria/pilus periplasmic chaperone, partial [Escherichia coli]|nr:fimbria/pilus periplasmic chaperone [Escherichia coli]